MVDLKLIQQEKRSLKLGELMEWLLLASSMVDLELTQHEKDLWNWGN